MLPSIRNASPPNIFISVTPVSPPRSSRIRSASASSYAIAPIVRPSVSSTLVDESGWDADAVDGSTRDAIEGAAKTTPRAVILVEGVSDRRALEALAARRGRVLTDHGVTVVAMDGAGNIGRFLDAYGPSGADVVLAGLYDAAEEPAVRRGLERAGF